MTGETATTDTGRAPRAVRAPRDGRRRRRRVPVVLQLNRVECGAACLAMVLSYHGRRTSVRACRDRCGGGRSGVSAGTVVRAARSYGLDARGVQASADQLAGLPLPLIVHWEGDHFVVVERIGHRRVDIVDPAWGRRRLTTGEFGESYSGTALVLVPGEGFTAGREGEPPAWRLMGAGALRLAGMRSLVVQVLAATLLLQLLGLALPLATKVLVDDVVAAGRPSAPGLLAAGLAVALLAATTTRYLRSSLLLNLQGRLDWEILGDFAGRLFALPLGYFQQRATGDILTRIASVAGLRDMLANQVLAAVLDAALVLVYVVAMFAFAPVLGLAVLGVLAAQGCVLLVTRGRARDLMAREVVAQVAVSDYLVQTLSGVATIKASGAEHHVVEGLRERIRSWTAHTLQRGHLSNWVDAVESALRLTAPLLVLLIGIVLLPRGAWTVGTVLAMTWVATAVVTTLSTVVTSVLQVQMAGLQLERLGDVTMTPPERSGSVPPPRGPGGACLEVQHVTFRYEAEAPPAVRDVSVRVEPGERLAIVGPSGAGKSTLAWLLLGLLEPGQGRVSYDGVSLADIDRRAMRATFGVVLQDTFMIAGTIRDNIALAHPEATDADVERAGRLAGIEDEVRSLPTGYRTGLAERGAGLSGGQLQRLAIARALVGRPRVLLLDEATSHLDAQTEARVLANIATVPCTQIVIAHRLSTVQNADRILVMREGAVVESGTHGSLLARQGVYAALVQAQLGQPAVRPGDGATGDRSGATSERR